MPKTLSSQLLSDIRSNVTTLATCIEVTRKDGRVLRMTTHDTDLVVEGVTYFHDMPFVLASIQSGTQLAVDNTQLTLFADETNIFLSDFKNALFEYAAVTIFQVNYTDPTRGIITMRKGWFGQIDYSENHIIQVTITGLLKVLDLEIGRIYQPSCDADLGDARCKIAIQQNQIRSELNPVNVGEWVYYYDPALMTALTVVNPSFEADGARTYLQAITGWTKTAGAEFIVAATNSGYGTFSVLDGSYMLLGAAVPSASYESGLYQDIDVSAQIADDAAIDAAKISVAFFAGVLSTDTVFNVWRLKMELLDADGVILDSQDTRYVRPTAVDVWREKACVLPLLPGTRTVRIWLYMLTGSGLLTGANAADRVRMYWWDHTAGNPYSDVVHRVTRAVVTSPTALLYMFNPSFEIGAPISNQDNPTISSWVPGTVNTNNAHNPGATGHWWAVVSTAFSGALAATDGVFFLSGGNDGGSVSNLYEISQVHALITAGAPRATYPGLSGLDTGRLLLGKYAGTFYVNVGYGDTTSKATIIVEWLDATNSVVGSFTMLNDVVGTVGWHNVHEDFTIPGAATKVRVWLKARSPTGSGNAKVAFDNVRFAIFDTERPTSTDPRNVLGSSATVFDTTIGNYTFDNGIIYKALLAFTAYDVVASVTDARKEFTGTNIAGADGNFETGPIRWLSGDNAGLTNIIRRWDSATQKLKLYFRTPHPIQVGDRYYYSVSCQRRFIEDCFLRFENTVNFRGFPYVPGALAATAQAGGTPLPVVYQSLPSGGPTAGGTTIAIIGNSNAKYVTSVKFGGVLGTDLVHVDDNTLHVTSPAHAAGAVDVTIAGTATVPGSTRTFANISVGMFTYS